MFKLKRGAKDTEEESFLGIMLGISAMLFAALAGVALITLAAK